jgi:hypothetical protein
MMMGQSGMGDMMDMGAPPNMAAVPGAAGPFHRIEMSGMFTVVKVREGIASYEDPGWYAHPADTVAEKAELPDFLNRAMDASRRAEKSNEPAGRDEAEGKHNGHRVNE